ncbi:MAG: hypothetical protein JRF72_07080 [Deltaproteobacteria bacterium]|jgi:hypothetical protein|nr:hypothetical protein [Deltaproteobacteria bacterium]
MSGTVLIRQGHEIKGIPQEDCEKGLSAVQQHIRGRLEFMSDEHHRVRNFVVRELPNAGEPLSPNKILERSRPI